MNKSILLCTCLAFSPAFMLNNAMALDMLPNTTHLSHTPNKIEPMPQASFQVAGLQFLPDYQYGDTGWGGHEFPENHIPNDSCSNYPLSSCPKGGFCTSCAFDRKLFRLESCSAPYIKSGSACSCPTATPMTCTNDKCTEYCDGNCINKTCTPTPNQTGCTNGTQKCDDGCCGQTRDCCVPCSHKVTSKPDNSSYTYSKCTDGNGTHDIQTGWSCNSGYKLCNGSCILNSQCCGGCPSGKECKNGSCVQKTCTPITCDGYQSFRPACSGKGLWLETCTEIRADCSRGATKYYCRCEPYWDGNRFVECSIM